MGDIVIHILKEEKDRDLIGNGGPGRKGDLMCRHAEVLTDGMEEPDLW